MGGVHDEPVTGIESALNVIKWRAQTKDYTD